MFKLKMKGTAIVEASVPFGNVTLSGLPLETSMTVKGLNGLQNISITAFDVPRNYPKGGLALSLNTTFINPTGARYIFKINSKTVSRWVHWLSMCFITTFNWEKFLQTIL